MARQDWDNLTHIEYCFYVNAWEIDILPGMLSDLDEDEQALPLEELARILLSMVDRGWVEVRRYAPWTSEDGRKGYIPGDVIPRSELPQVLTETVTWDYGAYHPSWAGAPTLVLTEAGRALGRRSPEEMPKSDKA